MELNKHAIEKSFEYLGLNVCGEKIVTPYYINNIQLGLAGLMKESGVSDEVVKRVFQKYKDRQIPFGWYRGKGTPEEIEGAVIAISDKVGFSLMGATACGILEFMKLYGLGVDCSGFVYNVLKHAFAKCLKGDLLGQSLDWCDENKTGVNYSGVYVFAGKASGLVNYSEVRPLDLVLIKDGGGKYSHIGVFLLDGNKLRLFQSSIITNPTGVTATDYSFDRVGPVFGFVPAIGSKWENLYKGGGLEFRRLHVLAKVF